LKPLFAEAITSDNFDEIESMRFDVEPQHLDFLLDLYSSLEGWDQKRAWVDLVQDQVDDRLRPMMTDFLQAPAGLYDAMDHARAVAQRFQG